MGKARPLVPTYARAEQSTMSAAPPQAAASRSAAVSRSSPACTTTSSPRPAATMSIRSSRFTSVGGGQGLGALDRQWPAVGRQRAPAPPRTQQLQAPLVVHIALAEQGPVAQRGVERGGAVALLTVGQQGRAPARERDIAGRRPHDDHLRVADGAVQLQSRSQFHEQAILVRAVGTV